MALKDCSIIEREIIGRYLDRVQVLAGERPATRVIVRDEGFEIAYKGSFDRAAIEEAIGQTDITKIAVSASDTERHSVMFIHGNDEDVVSDSGWSNEGEWLEEKLLAGVYA